MADGPPSISELLLAAELAYQRYLDACQRVLDAKLAAEEAEGDG